MSAKNISIIPNPQKVTESPGWFELKPDTVIKVPRALAEIGKHLQDYLVLETGFTLEIKDAEGNNDSKNEIFLSTDGVRHDLGDEGYLLDAVTDGISIRAAKPAGIFYGLQTLRQLIQDGVDSAKVVPAVIIQDKPRFKWRGMMLDVGRHFYPVEFIKRFIDILALHKMNVFHWHLTEDQGWRIEIKKYPKLHEIGSQRTGSQTADDQNRIDSTPYGGFYRQEEIKEIVAYAASRFITVVPEIEMPGHSLAALASYPELGCTGGPYEVQTTWGIKKDVFCGGNEAVYTFLEDVLSEVLELFPSPVIHIGGDEVPKDRWRDCPKCQSMIKTKRLKDEDELQSYFITRIEKFLNAQGRQLIGWDEILEGGLAPNAMVMSWRGIEGGIQAASAGHDVVMSPTSHCYFDYYQSKNPNEPPGPYWEGAYLPLEDVYAYEPIPDGLSPEQARHILGAQGNIWTEFIASVDHLEYMTYPRGTALAEVVWSAPEKRDFSDFTRRLQKFLPQLQKLDVKYRDPFEYLA
jgi:hexosaminidase